MSLQEPSVNQCLHKAICPIGVCLWRETDFKGFSNERQSEDEDLSCLDLPYSHRFDEALFSLAEQGLPLRKFSLPDFRGCGYGAISCLLRKRNNLQYLGLQRTQFLND
ncbi:hypothetical protein PIB30_066660 [Stylosanthes scabra]|uniref:Uncharacterized protein n=1 Tax=Stylosanthes scabra TaxID=79078 RepID=A0ABU6TM40_9FABA|nr:hypothetical protein [Stylosanthes scabra]